MYYRHFVGHIFFLCVHYSGCRSSGCNNVFTHFMFCDLIKQIVRPSNHIDYNDYFVCDLIIRMTRFSSVFSWNTLAVTLTWINMFSIFGCFTDVWEYYVFSIVIPRVHGSVKIHSTGITLNLSMKHSKFDSIIFMRKNNTTIQSDKSIIIFVLLLKSIVKTQHNNIDND